MTRSKRLYALLTWTVRAYHASDYKYFVSEVLPARSEPPSFLTDNQRQIVDDNI
jgi:hypothetical protein